MAQVLVLVTFAPLVLLPLVWWSRAHESVLQAAALAWHSSHRPEAVRDVTLPSPPTAVARTARDRAEHTDRPGPVTPHAYPTLQFLLARPQGSHRQPGWWRDGGQSPGWCSSSSRVQALPG